MTLILAIRTDKPVAELALWNGEAQIATNSWEAHRQLSATIFSKIDELYARAGRKIEQTSAVVCFAGPGSFTGLRIGFCVANALAYSYSIPVIAAGGEKWQEQGRMTLAAGNFLFPALPDYGEPAKTTLPKK